MQLITLGERVLAYYADAVDVPLSAFPSEARLIPYAGDMDSLGRLGPPPQANESDSREYRAPLTVDLAAYATSRRYTVEVGGMRFDGLRYRTDREVGQAKIARAELKALANPAYTIPDFKTVDGFVSLSNAEIIALADALDAHVQACFSAEAAAKRGAAAGTLTSTAQVDALFAAIG